MSDPVTHKFSAFSPASQQNKIPLPAVFFQGFFRHDILFRLFYTGSSP